MKISVRMTLFNFICLFALTLLSFSVFYGISRSSILASEKEDILRRSQTGSMRMMHGMMARGRTFPGDFLVGSQATGELVVVQNPWDLDPQVWKEGMVVQDGEYFLFIPVERAGEWFLVGKNISSTIQSLDRIGQVAWYLIPILASVVLVVGYFLSEYWLKPLRDLNRTLFEINSENLSARFPVAPTPDEIEELKFALNKMLNSLEEGYLVQKRFVSNVSHQLRTPLSALIGYSQMLRRWGDDDREVRREALEAIETTAEEMKELTENLLFLSRADQDMQKTGIFVEPVVKPLVEQWERKNPHRSLGFQVHASPWIETSEGHFKILIDILLDNALKYSSGNIDVTIGEREMTIRDYGPGITEELQSRLGERFLRGQSAIGQPGWGIGLALAREIAGKLGLDLVFENALPGPGLRVVIGFFPVEKSG